MGKMPECYECGMLVHSGTCLCSGCLTDWSKRIASTPMITEGEIKQFTDRVTSEVGRVADWDDTCDPGYMTADGFRQWFEENISTLLKRKGIRVVTDAQADALADDVEKGGGDG